MKLSLRSKLSAMTPHLLLHSKNYIFKIYSIIWNNLPVRHSVLSASLLKLDFDNSKR